MVILEDGFDFVFEPLLDNLNSILIASVEVRMVEVEKFEFAVLLLDSGSSHRTFMFPAETTFPKSLTSINRCSVFMEDLGVVNDEPFGCRLITLDEL